MKLKFKLFICLCLLTACENTLKTDIRPEDSSTDTSDALVNDKTEGVKAIDLYKYLQTDRKEGTRYNPVKNSMKDLPIEEMAEEFLAVVNGRMISKQEVYQFLRDNKEDLNIFPVFRDNKVHAACHIMIFNQLVDHALATKQLHVSKEDLAQQQNLIDKIIEEKSINKEKLLKNKNLTENELNRMLHIFAYVNSLVTDEMIKKQYEKDKLKMKQHRLIVFLSQGGKGYSEDDLPHLKKKIRKIRKVALKTKDLGPLSIKYSHHPLAKSTKGMMDFVQGDTRAHSKFYDVIFDLKEEGDISEIYTLPENIGTGYYIVQLKKINYPTLDAKRDDIVNTLTEKLQKIFYDKLRLMNQVNQRDKPEVPEEFRSKPEYK